VNSIVIVDSGTNYTYANVIITSADSGSVNAAARAIISPPGGHGSDPLYEIGGRNIMINARLKYSENSVLPITNDYRQISLLKNPLLNGTTTEASNTAFLQCMAITVVGSGDYTQDEWVYQGASFAAAAFRGRVVSWDSTTSKLLLINIRGTSTASQSLIGVSSFTVRAISSVAEEDFEKYSGKILYVDNIKPITRADDQIEDFKILMKFAMFILLNTSITLSGVLNEIWNNLPLA
jgi:hypothetical protein